MARRRSALLMVFVSGQFWIATDYVRHDIVTKDDLVILASEVGVLDVPPEMVLEKRRLQPGRMLSLTARRAASLVMKKSSRKSLPPTHMVSGSANVL